MQLLKLSNKIAKIAYSVFRILLLFGLSVIVLYPLMYSVSVAFRSAQDLYDPLVIYIPKHFTFDNIIESIKYLKYWSALLNSSILCLLCSFLQVISCSLVGYGLARYNFKGKGLVFTLVLVLIIVPPQTISVPNYVNFRYFDPVGLGAFVSLFTGKPSWLNLIDTNWSFFIPATFAMGIRSGLFIFIFRQFFRGMPKDLEEAAYIDGSGQFKTFLRIMVPNAGGAYLTVTLFSIVWYWNDYINTSSFLANANTVSYNLYKLTGSLNYIMKYEKGLNQSLGIVFLQSGVLLTILPMLIMYIILQKYFTESIERTGIVG